MAFNKDKVMDAARKFVDKGQIDKAVKEYLRIVHEDPKDVRVWLKIGDLYAKKGSKQEAIETYLKVARFYHDQGFFLKAVAVYKQILKLDPRLVEVILKLAELYRQLGLMSDAMQHFESVAAHFHREGNTKEALATVKKLVDLDPENIATRIKLAELYSKEGLVEDAANEFSNACEQLRRQARQDDFLKVAERLLWHKPDNNSLNRELAGLYLRRNDPRRALQKLQACFKADPRDVETLGLLAQAFQALDQKAKTVSVLKELARIHQENKQREKAGDVFRKILEFVPTDPDALAFLGAQAAARAPVAAPPIPPPRQQTPMPAPIRQATAEVKFNITSDLPALPASSRMTGSMPLVDDQSLSGVDFALPEYDDHDFSADMEPPADPRAMSAAGEQHAEEISKILAETDVYVKYGLHQKAVDHLRRVFTLDPENVEARERLKDIFVSQGREQEAELELLKLAETVASGDPDRAEVYLQELLAINGTHTGAFELARRFRLRVARMSSVSSEVEYAGGGVAAVDVDMDELELAAPPMAAMGIARNGGRRDSIDDFDANELVGRVAHGSPAPARPPGPPVAGYQAPYEDNFDMDFEPSPSQATGQMTPDQALALASAELDDDPLMAPSVRWGSHDSALVDAVEAQLDDDALGSDIDNEVAAELAGASSDDMHFDLPFDPDDARSFDTGLSGDGKTTGTEPVYVTGFEETALPKRATPFSDTSSNSFDLGDANDEGTSSGTYDPYSTEALQTPASAAYGDATQAHAVGVGFDHAGGDDDNYDAAVAPPVQARAESTVEDELDEADFYTSQGMIPEALDVLNGLILQYPNHRLILAKLAEVEAILNTSSGNHDAIDVAHDSIEQEVDAHHDTSGHEHTAGTGALDMDEIDEIEEVGLEDIEEVPDGRAARRKGASGAVMLERPVDEGDADTHYDLGLAYKEMGLYDEAIKAFEKTLRAPNREVQCRVMIGVCYREQGLSSEAILQYKAGLHAEPSEREQLSLYYEIAVTYESIGDEAEALYYFDSVMKRDPHFADCSSRAEMLRARVGRGVRPPEDDDI
ncbi:MAG: tetratricopeptide repeat protein [Deltaproteobacteria bacterium]|nr:tetratricopeptide repeat protein [Deltaproteobacteria bacterium]